MFGVNYGGDNPQQAAASQADQTQEDIRKELERERESRQRLEQQVNDLRNHQLRSAEASSQQISLLRGQLAEAVRPQAQAAAPAQANVTDDWMSFLGNGAPQQQQQSAPQQQGGLFSEQQVRSIIQKEKEREAQAHFAEAQKVQELNARFVAEFPELRENQTAIRLIQNQFQAVSNLRPDLPAETRYKMAVDNVRTEMLPLVAAPKEKNKEKEPVDKQPTNPYMPSIFAPPPGQASLQTRLGIVDDRSLEDKMAKRQQEIVQQQKQQAKLRRGF